MLSVSDNNITMTRGDTAYLTVPLTTVNGNEYSVTYNDSMRFTVRKKTDDDEIVLQKLVLGNNSFRIAPADTADLEYGKYVYDIELTTGGGDVYTVVTKHYFILTEEITR